MLVSAILGAKGNAIYSVAPADKVSAVIDLLAEKRIGAVLVVSNESLHGVFSERDIVRTLKSIGPEALSQPVENFMTREVFTCAPTDTVHSLMSLMTERRIRHVPVMESGGLIGMITIGDVVKHRIAEAEAESDALKSYIATG